MKKICMMLVLTFVLGVFLAASTDQPAQAEDSNKISGKITSVAYGAWTPFGRQRSTLVIEDRKGNSHTVFIGRSTVYIPHRIPVVGDKVSVVCMDKNGLQVGVSVTYE